MTRRPDGTLIYTPFPNYEKEITDGGAVTERATYSIAGQMVAVRAAGVLYYTYTDHLGNVVLLSKTDGSIVSGSNARYDPFGNYRTWPGSNANPLISDRGFTGHIHDNTGPYPTQNVGLIYMNARYYLPEVGRFISADTIVPEPGEPQSYNRYSYVRNSPMNFTDPTGHRECFDSDASGCTIVAPYDLSSEPPAKPPSPPPSFIPAVPPFNIPPLDLAQISPGVSMQGFGDTRNAYDHRKGTDEEMYMVLGNLHSAWDIPVPVGTELYALESGSVICAGERCGLQSGQGIAIYYKCLRMCCFLWARIIHCF